MLVSDVNPDLFLATPGLDGDDGSLEEIEDIHICGPPPGEYRARAMPAKGSRKSPSVHDLFSVGLEGGQKMPGRKMPILTSTPETARTRPARSPDASCAPPLRRSRPGGFDRR